ncbi:lamin dm0-like isoform x1 protein [Lasius niger]|uniref:Lamin dm0-like isoform x1 protein n=1 Tax=Lasius niger TaxID=67767 RepID=A0A0J7K1C8_LASNI|nr:lamin dm0-like isoform x1 protein [Lasius niger]
MSTSPTRYSGSQEEQDLRNLNDRLACYMKKVRYLKTENLRLKRKSWAQTTQETSPREKIKKIKIMYEHELSDAWKLFNETDKEYAKLEIDKKTPVG